MVGMGSVVTRDVPPWAKAFGNPARVRDANTVGMEHAGIEEELIAEAAALYRGDLSRDGLDALRRGRLADAVDEWSARTAG